MKTKTLKLTLTKLADVTRELQELVAGNPSNAFSVKVSDYSSKRSLPANRAYQAWIPSIADELAMTIPEATCYIKRNFGLPILLADDYLGPLIGEGLNAKGYFQLSYEQQMFEMIKLPVTRLFDTKMHNRLRDDLQNHFGAMGLILDYK